MDHPAADPMLVRLGLERANPKIIGCDLYRYAIAGRTFDGINEKFVAKFCSTCLQRSPRPAGWTFYEADAGHWCVPASHRFRIETTRCTRGRRVETSLGRRFWTDVTW